MVAPKNAKLEIGPGVNLQKQRSYLNKQAYMRDCVQSRIGTTVNGKQVFLSAPHKRPKPEKCELCEGTTKKMGYHHWDDEHPSHGMWLCYHCHMTVERWAKGDEQIIAKYLILKDIVDDELSGLE